MLEFLSFERSEVEEDLVGDDLFDLIGISRMNSTDSYWPRMKPSLGGQSGCMHGLDITMKCLGDVGLSEASRSRSGIAAADSNPGACVGRSSAAEEVTSKVTKSLGVVGPGN